MKKETKSWAITTSFIALGFCATALQAHSLPPSLTGPGHVPKLKTGKAAAPLPGSLLVNLPASQRSTLLTYQLANPEKQLASSPANQLANPEKQLASSPANQLANPEKQLASPPANQPAKREKQPANQPAKRVKQLASPPANQPDSQPLGTLADSSHLLEGVVITATKFAKNQGQTGKVLTVIDEAMLRRSSGKDLAQLLNEQAGIVVNGANSSPGKDKSVYLRGAGSEYTLILIDGIPLSDPSGVGGSFDIRMLPIDQIERIEILKGSQSTLYGTDAIAGVINIISKKKAEKPLQAFGTLGYGSFGTTKVVAGVSGKAGLATYHISASNMHTVGLSEAKDQEKTGTFDKDFYRQQGLQANVGLQLTPTWQLNPYLRLTHYRGKYDAGAFADDKNADFYSRFLNVGATSQLDIGKGKITGLYGKTLTDRRYAGQYGTFPYTGSFDHAEVYLNHPIGKYVQVLTGGAYQAMFMRDDGASKPNPSYNIVSPYASLFLQDYHGLSAELGARYNRHSVFGQVLTYSINPTYTITTKLRVFANMSTGYKAPTLNELYGAFGANPGLKPQQSTTYEGGIVAKLPSPNIMVRATVFSRQLKDAIVYAGAGFINQNKQNDLGLEIEPSYIASSRLTIRGFYAFVNGQVTTKTPSGADTSYQNLIRRPRNTFGVSAQYQLTKAFSASANLKTFGKRKDLFFSVTDFSTSSADLAAYYLLDLYLEYRLKGDNARVFVDAKNLLNQNYFESYGYSTLPINVQAGVSFQL